MDDSKPIKVTVYSDYVCPFCWMGEASLETARQSVPMEVEWRAFELRPAGSPPMEASYKERIAASWPGVQEMGRQYGVDMRTHRFGVGTRDAHRALKIVQRLAPGMAQAFNDALFHAYFTDDQDLGELEVLVAVAERVGVNGAALRAALVAGEALAAVVVEEDEAHAMGISGVPAFIFQDKYLVSGVMPPEQLIAAVAEVRRLET